MKQSEQTTFNMRVDKHLVEQFKQAARDNNRTASQLLRDCMIDYVKRTAKQICLSVNFV